MGSEQAILKEIPGSLVDEIKKYFLERQYKAGDKIETEYELAKKFNVSRSKVREAIIAMYHQGLLSRKPRAGTKIREFNPAALGEDLAFRFKIAGFKQADTDEARQIVELALLPLVMRRITPAQLQKLEETVNHMEEVLDDPIKAEKADCKFHYELLLACGNMTMHSFAGIIDGLFRKTITGRNWTKQLLKDALKDHKAIIAAIKKDDLAQALEIVRNHWNDLLNK